MDYCEAEPVQYRHTMVELENEVNRYMIEACKADACVDLFLSRVWDCTPDETKQHHIEYGSYHYEECFKMAPDEKQKAIVSELRHNLNRLVPGYLPEQSNDILNEEKLKSKIKTRWRIIGFEASGDQKDIVPKSLVDTLVDKHYKERLGPPRSPVSGALSESYRKLRSFIEGERAAASFSCGGKIAIINTTDREIGGDELAVSPPVTIFWSKEGNSNAHRLVLPIHESTPESSSETLRRLVIDCDPASFGRGEQDVIDPEYRKAGKINVDQFATSFHPADFGILENIGQVLLPSISSENDNALQFRKIKAELYKMNVYSGPSGLFRKHVDTPRAANQIGSLVVCLPSAFTGGRLSVEHHGQKVEFDWSANSASTIQWAAFYSDCEHEIETITQGDRITLTYNLYVTEPVGGAIPSPTSIVDPKTLPMYGWIKNLLAQEDFMKDGGVLGIFCSHAYPHSSKLAKSQLPRALKGADLVLYSVLQSLGIVVDILPVLETGGKYCDGNPELEISGKSQKSHHYMEQYWYCRDGLMEYLREGQLPLSPVYSELLPGASSSEYEDIDQRWKLLFAARQVRNVDKTFRTAQRENPSINEKGFSWNTGAQVGTSRHRYLTTSRGYDESLDDVVRVTWPAYYLPGITWVTEPKHEEMAFSQIAYGNEASIGTRYSCAAIFAVIPPASERGGSLCKV